MITKGTPRKDNFSMIRSSSYVFKSIILSISKIGMFRGIE